MHPAAVHDQVRRLAADGLGASAIARETGLARSTVRTIVAPAHDRAAATGTCPRCWRALRPMHFGPGEYAELLGLYLGDGDIARVSRAQRLRLHLDARHTHVVDTIEALLRTTFPRQVVARSYHYEGRMVILSVHSQHLACLFPQVGPGMKHERPIVLEGWQLEHVAAAPYAFLRGLLWTDGCFFINRTGRYAYLSAEFSNVSADIRGLFALACDLVGVQYRVNGRSVRVYRRDSVQRLAVFVGLKR